MQMIGGSDALMRGGKLDGGLQTTLRRLLFGGIWNDGYAWNDNTNWNDGV